MSKSVGTQTSSPSVVLGKRSATQLTFALLQGFHISNAAKEMLRQRNFVSPVTKNKVVRVIKKTVRWLGFPEGADYEHICAAGIMHHFFLCPAEIGPLLRLGWKSQPQIERKLVRVAMKPIQVSTGNSIFCLAHNYQNGLVLDVEEIFPDDFYGPEEDFVFATPFRPSVVPWKE